MRFNKLDLNLLVALNALTQDCNVSRAAERLNMSQSAMSGALARLREFFGDELLIQIGRRMVLTPLAENLADQVRDVLLRSQVLMDTKSRFDPASAERKIRIIASDYIVDVLLLDVIRHIKNVAPGICLEIISHSDKGHDLLDRGEVEFLILPDLFADPKQPSTTLFSDSFVCCVWSGNDKIGGSISLERYLDMDHVVVRFGLERTYTSEHNFFERSSYTRKQGVVVPSFNVAPRIVVGTDLITTVPVRQANLSASNLPLRLIPVPIELPPLVEAIQWNRSFERDLALAWLRNLIIQSASATEQQRVYDRHLSPHP